MSTEDTPNYQNAINNRERALERLRANPPTAWSEEYLKRNMELIQEQIDQFKELMK